MNKSLVGLLALACIALTAIFAPVSVARSKTATSYPYTLVDPGTFGGPQSFLNLPAVPLSKQGALLGTADTTIADSDYPNFNPFMVGFPDPYLVHAFTAQNGHLNDLGALPGNNSSAVFEMNGNGAGVGMSETATTDPYTGWPSDHAVMFKNRQAIDLGTLPGGYESQANDINDRGQISGFASNGVADPYSFFGWGTQSRSFIWQNGHMQDIGTLGGPDAVSTTLNERGQITGQSYTNNTVNEATGMPTLDPFIWQNGQMHDLGTLGGTVGFANWMNNAGDVVGQSDLAGDETAHPFLWNGTKMIDLGGLGGTYGFANWVNDASHVTGDSNLADGSHRAFLWKTGRMHGLPPLSGASCSNGNGINNSDEVVGNSTDCSGNSLGAELWVHGIGYNLNALIAPSSLFLADAVYIDDKGDIVGLGVLPDGNQHVFLLVPNGKMGLSESTASASTNARPTAPSRPHQPQALCATASIAARSSRCALH